MTEQLPPGWTECSLGDIRADRSSTLDPRSDPSQDFELYSVPSFLSGQPEVVKGQEIGSSKRTVEPGTVLVCKINPRINRVWVVGNHTPHPKIASTEWIPFFPSKGINPRYLAWYLRQDLVKNYLATNVSGVGGSLMRVRPAVLEAFPLRLAPGPEQDRIVEALDSYFSRLDDVEAGLARVERNLKRYRASVLQAAVTGRLVPTEASLARAEGRSYEPASELLERILVARRGRFAKSGKKGKYREPPLPEASTLPHLPEGWCWATLPQLGELDRGKSKHRPRNDPRLLGGPYPFIQTGDVRRAKVFIEQFVGTYSEMGLAQSRLWPAGTLCITIAANIAETGILKFPACFPDSVVGFVSSGSPGMVRFVEMSIRAIRARIASFAPATAQKNINLQTLSRLALPLPPDAERDRIVAEFDRLSSLATVLHDTASNGEFKLRRLRQAILQRAFEGDI